MSPAWQLALIAALAATQGVAAAVAVAAWRSARRRGREAEGRLAALEGRLGRLEARRASARARAGLPGGPRAGLRPDAPAAGPTLIAVPNLAAPPAPAAPGPAAAELGRRFGDIWAMADAGAPADAIARETGQPVGQVELILGLRRQLEAASAGGRA